MTALGTIDDWVGTFFIVVLAAVQIICFGWVWGMDAGMKEAHVGAHVRIPRIFWFVIKWVAPAYLLVTIGRFVWTTLPGWVQGLGGNEVARNTVFLILAIVVLLVAFTALGEKRWRAAGLDLDGKLPPPDEQVPVAAKEVRR